MRLFYKIGRFGYLGIGLILSGFLAPSHVMSDNTITIETIPFTSCAAEAYNGAYYKRQAILVSNMDRALTLYRDLLGFKLTGSVNETASDSYTRQVMNIPPQAKVRTAALDAGTVQVRTLLLVEVTGVPLAQPTSTSILTSASVINVHGRLSQIVQAVKNLGLKTLPSHREGDPAKPDDMGTEVAFSDWDGNRILGSRSC